jgi:predicted flap endonuclease-1-like 5' DNA nuclease
MKRLLRFAAIVAGLGAAAWLVKDRLLPTPSPPVGPAPSFRSAPPEATPRPAPAPEPTVPAAPTAAATDDLTEIKGIGPVYAERLAGAGITTFGALAGADPAGLAATVEVREDQAASWIEQAAARTTS